MAEPPKFHIRPVQSASDLATTKLLFTAYAASLGIDLTFQNFPAELEDLPGKYAPPTGQILLAHDAATDAVIGCVALRPLAIQGVRCCEMKRLYCTPEARGLGVGKALIGEILDWAAVLGYEELRLDTLPSMEGARALYKKAGFVEIEGYYDTPLVGTIFLAKGLRR